MRRTREKIDENVIFYCVQSDHDDDEEEFVKAMDKLQVWIYLGLRRDILVYKIIQNLHHMKLSDESQDSSSSSTSAATKKVCVLFVIEVLLS